jgi:hypothetical protein
MNVLNVIEILEEMISRAKREKMWGVIEIEFKNGEAIFIHKNETTKLLMQE